MSRLTTMSPAAIKAMFSPDSDEILITLLTIYDEDNVTPVIRVADNYLQRLSETADHVIYGVQSRGNDYIFLPINITLPSDEDNSAPRCTLTISDVTRDLTPIIRELAHPPRVALEMVLSSSPNTVEVSFYDFYITNITYNAETVTCNLEMINYQLEPFPCFSFTPRFFPGLF